MSTVLNDRDVLLRATVQRLTPARDRALLVGASANVIRTAYDGSAPDPAAVTFTATLLNMTGTVTWSVAPALDMSVNGNQATIMASAFGSLQSAIVTAKLVKDGVGYEAKQTVVKVSDGAKGINGTPVYTWIKYADSATGSGIADDPTGKSYIGLAYNRSTPIESNLPGDYMWSLFRGGDGPQGPQGTQGIQGLQGVQGTQGVQGPSGPDGRPTYTWIAYSDSPNGANMYQVPTAATTYIGIATNKVTDAESSNPADYVWSKFKGDQGVEGPQGPQGQQGPRGPQGQIGDDGQRGTMDIAVSGYQGFPVSYQNGLSPDLQATYIFRDSTGELPINRDRMTLYGGGKAETRFYDNGVWRSLNAYINGNMLVSGTLSADQISTGTLNSIQIRAGTGGTPSGRALEITAGGVLYADNVMGGVARLANYNYPYANAVEITVSSNSSAAGLVVRGLTLTRDIMPSSGNSFACGTAAAPWASIASATAVVVTSDARSKEDIRDSDLGLNFVNSLRPVSYRMASRDNRATESFGPWPEGQTSKALIEPQPGVRRHYGFIAQEVRNSLGDADAGIWVLSDKDDPDSLQALRYEELIAPLVKAVQELSTHLQSQQQEINQLKEA